MTIDSYSRCPGGHDKKIRFCCPDSLSKLKKIDSLIAGGQFSAGLAYVEQLEKNQPDCACLTSAKCLFLRSLDRWGEALALATEFVEREPDNVLAHLEKGLCSAVQGLFPDAVSELVDAIELKSPGEIDTQIPMYMYLIGRCFHESGLIFPAIAITKQLNSFASGQREVSELLFQCLSDTRYPLILKELAFDHTCPDGFSGKETYDQAVQLLRRGHWKKGLKQLESLLPLAGEWPAIYRSVAIVCFWLCRNEEGCRTLRQFTDSPDVPKEDAVDAEMFMRYFADSFYGDEVTLEQVTLNVSDGEKVKEILLSCPVCQVLNNYPIRQNQPGTPPPQQYFALVSKPFLSDDTVPTCENVPRLVAQIEFYGKETDRDARLTVFPIEKEPALKSLQEICGGYCDFDNLTTEAIGRISQTEKLQVPNFVFKNQGKITPEQTRELYNEYFSREFVETWTHLPLGMLDGETPLNAVATPAGKRLTTAAINLIELYVDPVYSDTLGKALRQYLKLDEPQPIVPPAEMTHEQFADFLEKIPVWRWHRVALDTLSHENLIQFFHVAGILRDQKTLARLAFAVLAIPAAEVDADDRNMAYRAVVGHEMTLGEVQSAMNWLQKGYDEMKELNRSDSFLNLDELSIAYALRDLQRFLAIFSHIVKNHSQEKNVMQSLQMMLQEFGLVNPDGSLRINPEMAAAGPAPDVTQKEKSGLWTPGNDSPTTGEKGNESKLWVPD